VFWHNCIIIGVTRLSIITTDAVGRGTRALFSTTRDRNASCYPSLFTIRIHHQFTSLFFSRTLPSFHVTVVLPIVPVNAAHPRNHSDVHPRQVVHARTCRTRGAVVALYTRTYRKMRFWVNEVTTPPPNEPVRPKVTDYPEEGGSYHRAIPRVTTSGLQRIYVW
jgi:hypothetical protein